jgi:hypothetical protein
MIRPRLGTKLKGEAAKEFWEDEKNPKVTFGDAYLAKKGITNIVNHKDRHKKYQKNLPANVYTAYKILEGRSIIARYHPELSNVLTVSDLKDLYTNEFLKLKSLV